MKLIANIRWIVAAWIVGFVILSLQPARLNATGGGTWAHLILHAFAFGFPAFLLTLLPRPKLWIPILVAFCVGGGIELAQAYLYRNPFEWEDLSADVLGAVLATVASCLIRSARQDDGGDGPRENVNIQPR